MKVHFPTYSKTINEGNLGDLRPWKTADILAKLDYSQKTTQSTPCETSKRKNRFDSTKQNQQHRR